jgi:S1-C subfamily serine protease
MIAIFITQVLCDHSELSFRRPGQNAHPQRVYAKGRIIGISCEDDLLLIQVPREDVVDLDEICMRNHPHLTFSSTQPVAFDVCAMVSWPPLRHRTAVIGRVSHTSRSFDDLGQDNPVGYRMNLIEVRIGSELGSSGAPLVNGNGKVIGMLHGGFKDAFSYFLSLNDIMLFLAHRGVAVIRKFLLLLEP